MRAQLFSCFDRLVNNVSIMSNYTSTFMDKKGCSIEKVMQEVYVIDDVQFASELHTFAIEFFYLQGRREMWVALRLER